MPCSGERSWVLGAIGNWGAAQVSIGEDGDELYAVSTPVSLKLNRRDYKSDSARAIRLMGDEYLQPRSKFAWP